MTPINVMNNGRQVLWSIRPTMWHFTNVWCIQTHTWFLILTFTSATYISFILDQRNQTLIFLKQPVLTNKVQFTFIGNFSTSQLTAIINSPELVFCQVWMIWNDRRCRRRLEWKRNLLLLPSLNTESDYLVVRLCGKHNITTINRSH